MKKLLILSSLIVLVLGFASPLASAVAPAAAASAQDEGPEPEPVDKCEEVDCEALLGDLVNLYVQKYALQWQLGFLDGILDNLNAQLNGACFAVDNKLAQIDSLQLIVTAKTLEAETVCGDDPNSVACQTLNREITFYQLELDRARAELIPLENAKAALEAQIDAIQAERDYLAFVLTDICNQFGDALECFNECCDELTEEELEEALEAAGVLDSVLEGLLDSWLAMIDEILS
jgi:hypothetical protein